MRLVESEPSARSSRLSSSSFSCSSSASSASSAASSPLTPSPLQTRTQRSSLAMTDLTPLALCTDASSQANEKPQTSTPRIKPKPKHRLCILPGTAAEWKAALRDIKRLYADDRYRSCSDRCHDILSNAKDLDHVQPTHLVYLRFYAASALEMQARALPSHPSSSRLRVSLLQQARAHYLAASDLAQQADEGLGLPSGRISFPMPRNDVSRSTSSSRMPSPVPSLCSSTSSSSTDDGPRSPEPVASKPKKRVSFRDVPVIAGLDEPMVRPDSPTLGLDDWLAPSSPRLPTPLYPEPILKHGKTPELSGPEEEYHRQQPEQDEEGKEVPGGEKAADSFVHIHFIHRYATVISDIRDQITGRLALIDAEITASQAPAPVATACLSDELRILDLKARIERLRVNGWRRPRFDPRRYETLRDNALADLLE